MKRVLYQWVALKEYFDKEAQGARSARVLRVDEHLKDPLCKLVLLVLQFALDSFCRFNATFQLDLPKRKKVLQVCTIEPLYPGTAHA